MGPLNVSHTGQLPSVTIAFNLKEGVALGDAVNAIQETAAATLPSTVTTSFQGAAQAFQDSLRGLGLILLMAIVVIYIVLGVLYESFTHPLTILSGLPAAGFGALLTLLIFKAELSLYAFVGIIMLIGLVKKNGIMMVDFAVAAQRERGLSPRDAIHEACLVRFRPIMMTTMAALVGTLPIALGLGAGAESRRPLGLAVVGGLLVSQLLTRTSRRYYVYIENARMWLAGHRQPARAGAERAPATAAAMETAHGRATSVLRDSEGHGVTAPKQSYTLCGRMKNGLRAAPARPGSRGCGVRLLLCRRVRLSCVVGSGFSRPTVYAQASAAPIAYRPLDHLGAASRGN